MGSAWVRPEDILNATARWTGIDATLLSERRGSPRVCHARAVMCATLREQIGMSYPEIGKFLGRDHTTILSLLQRTDVDEDDVNGVAQLARKIRETVSV